MSGYIALSGNALVTGAASGMGKAIATTYAKAGAAGVYLVDLNPVSLERAVVECRLAATNPKFKAVAGVHDIRSEEDVIKMLKRFKEEFGRLDYAANFAGIYGLPNNTITDLPLKAYNNIMQTNITGMLLCVQHELRLIETQEAISTLPGRVPQKGAIVNADSVAAFAAVPDGVAYTISKHAVLGLTRAAAANYSNTSGIRINAVAPGVIQTPMIDNAALADRQFFQALTANGSRWGQPEEVADVAVFLTSPNASFVNGQTWVVDNEQLLSLVIPNA